MAEKADSGENLEFSAGSDSNKRTHFDCKLVTSSYLQEVFSESRRTKPEPKVLALIADRRVSL